MVDWLWYDYGCPYSSDTEMAQIGVGKVSILFFTLNNGHIFLEKLSKQILRYNFEENMFKDKKKHANFLMNQRKKFFMGFKDI